MTAVNSVLRSFKKNWFLLCLAAAVLSGYFFWSSMVPIADSRPFRNAIVATVLFVMALPLELRAVTFAICRPLPVMLAVGITFGLLPLLCWALSHTLNAELAAGLMVAAATPCSLASAAIWTRRAGGNDSVAILVTIVTNLTCFVISPFWLLVTTGQTVTVDTAGDMVAKLGLLVVVPIIGAQLLRLCSPFAAQATKRKTTLGVFAQLGMLTMVVLGSAKAGRELAGLGPHSDLSPVDFLTMFLAVALTHSAMLWVGHQLGRLLGLERADRIAVGFSGSQKTLVVGLHLAVTYYGGLVILPMVTYHIFQLLFDTIIADKLRE